MQTKQWGVFALITVAVFAATGADNGGCENSGVGHFGTVTSKFQDRKTKQYKLTINDNTKGSTTFVVPARDYRECSVGESYPDCRVKW